MMSATRHMRLIAVFASLAIGSLVADRVLAAGPDQQKVSQANTSQKTVRMRIAGMTCAACAKGLERCGFEIVIDITPSPGQTAPNPGAIVHIRQRLYLVEQVQPPPHAGDATLVTLSCVDDDAQGQALDVLWEPELAAEIRGGENWGRLAERGFDPPQRFAAYLNTLRWNCVTSTDPRLLQSPFRAGIRLDPYQLEPLRKALRLPRVNANLAHFGQQVQALGNRISEFDGGLKFPIVARGHTSLAARTSRT